MWSAWRLHADALAATLQDAGEPTIVVGGPDDAAGILVAAVDAPDLVAVVRRRSADGRDTVVWGGTLSPARVAVLRAAGARGYVSALALPRELVDVVRRVRDGEEVLWPPASPGDVELTAREREAARAYLVTGTDHPRAGVALDLGISEHTLKAHISRIREKAGHEGTATREGLLHELVRRGWL